MPRVDEGFTHTRCCVCKQYKPVDQFGVNKRKLKSGETVVYYMARCKPCEAKRQADRRRDPEKRTQEREYHRSARRRNTPEYREYQREWAAAKRRKEGVPIRGSYKLRGPARRDFVDPTAFLRWADETFPELNEDELKAVKRMRAQTRTELKTIDKIMTRHDATPRFTDEYGDVPLLSWSDADDNMQACHDSSS